MLSRFSRVRLCDPVDCSPPGSFVRGILQGRRLEWLPRSPPGDLPNSGIKPASFMSPVLATYLFFSTSATWGASGTGKSQELRFCSQNLLQLQQSRGL